MTDDRSHLVGIDIGGTNLRIALGDASGAIVARTQTSTVGIRDPHLVVRVIRDSIKDMLAKTGISSASIAAVGAGAPGVTNVDTGIVIATSYLLGWRDVPLKALLEEELGCPAAVDNDVNLAALGESYFGAARNTRDFVFIALGTGVGAGIILRGELFQGAGWTAGEIGYMLVPGGPEEPVDLGKPGALEAVAGGEGIKAHWLSVWDATKTTLPHELNATQVFDAAQEGDVLANLVLDRAAKTLAYAIFNMSLIANTPMFVMGGSVGLHPALIARTQMIVNAHARRLRPQIVPSSLGSDAQLLGAIRLAQLVSQKTWLHNKTTAPFASNPKTSLS